jgi:hypothetical protein
LFVLSDTEAASRQAFFETIDAIPKGAKVPMLLLYLNQSRNQPIQNLLNDFHSLQIAGKVSELKVQYIPTQVRSKEDLLI